jgi:acetyl-CoA carboxylase carboxyl transferase subunit alpha
MGIADEIIPEPVGGAHRNYDEAARILQEKIEAELQELTAIPTEELLEARYQRYRKIGHWAE